MKIFILFRVLLILSGGRYSFQIIISNSRLIVIISNGFKCIRFDLWLFLTKTVLTGAYAVLHMIIKIVCFIFELWFIVIIFETLKINLHISPTQPSDVDSILHHPSNIWFIL